MTEFLRSYLFVYLFCLSLSLGSLANLMMHQLTGGQWGQALRAPLLAAASLLPAVAICWFPLLFDLPAVFPWMSDPASVAANRWWLNRPFFLGRTAFYLLVWALLALRWTTLALRSREPRTPQLIRWSAAGVIVYAITISAAAVDWIMSLTPHWYSSTFGGVVGVGAMQTSMAFAVLFQSWGGRAARTGQEGDPPRGLFGDFGNLLLMYVLLLTYLTYTQFLIVWSEDLPHEIAWYWPRLHTDWRAVTLALIFLQFIIPFVLLLMRAIKRRRRSLGMIAAILLSGDLLMFFYLVKPAFLAHGLAFRWSDPLVAILLIGAWWLAWRYRIGRGAQQTA